MVMIWIRTLYGFILNYELHYVNFDRTLCVVIYTLQICLVVEMIEIIFVVTVKGIYVSKSLDAETLINYFLLAESKCEFLHEGGGAVYWNPQTLLIKTTMFYFKELNVCTKEV